MTTPVEDVPVRCPRCHHRENLFAFEFSRQIMTCSKCGNTYSSLDLDVGDITLRTDTLPLVTSPARALLSSWYQMSPTPDLEGNVVTVGTSDRAVFMADKSSAFFLVLAVRNGVDILRNVFVDAWGQEGDALRSGEVVALELDRVGDVGRVAVTGMATAFEVDAALPTTL